MSSKVSVVSHKMSSIMESPICFDTSQGFRQSDKKEPLARSEVGTRQA